MHKVSANTSENFIIPIRIQHDFLQCSIINKKKIHIHYNHVIFLWRSSMLTEKKMKQTNKQNSK